MVDESFFVEKFGKLEYLAVLDEPYPEGLIITDYLADFILATNSNCKGKSYAKILGNYTPEGCKYDSLKINGIVYTGYEESNAAFLEKISSGALDNSTEYYPDEGFMALSSDIYSLIG